MGLPATVKMVEVGPRDGLQNEKTTVTVETRVELIDRLSGAGLTVIEAGSFVSPKWVPQMAATDQVLARIKRTPGVSYPVLVPNLKGLAGAIDAGVTEIAVFSAASETFTQKNTNCSITESLERAARVCGTALAEGMLVRGYISCVLGCPYEGDIAADVVADVAGKLLAMGCYEISLGDTIGVGTPGKARAMVERVAEQVPMKGIAVHFHDTYGQALANVYACLEVGVAVVDSSVAGLGGCPYAQGATGNVASEDILYMLNGLGIETGIDMDKLLAAGRFISDQLGRPPVSRAARALAKGIEGKGGKRGQIYL